MQKQLTDYRLKCKKAEQDITTLEGIVRSWMILILTLSIQYYSYSFNNIFGFKYFKA